MTARFQKHFTCDLASSSKFHQIRPKNWLTQTFNYDKNMHQKDVNVLFKVNKIKYQRDNNDNLLPVADVSYDVTVRSLSCCFCLLLKASFDFCVSSKEAHWRNLISTSFGRKRSCHQDTMKPWQHWKYLWRTMANMLALGHHTQKTLFTRFTTFHVLFHSLEQPFKVQIFFKIFTFPS